MLTKLYVKFKMHRWKVKQQNEIYKTVKFICDDCGRKGLVVRQISILNLVFWFLLGVGTLFLLRYFGFGWFESGVSGFLVWYISTGINVKLNKPQCRHCLSFKVRNPQEEKTTHSHIEDCNHVSHS